MIKNFGILKAKAPALKPLIGITTYFVSDEELRGRRVRGAEGQDMLMSNLDYSRSVLEGGGIPVALPTLDDHRAAAELVQRLDGLLLAGGEDLAPALFRQEVQPGLGKVIERRDQYEWALLQAALYQDLAAYHSNEIPHHSAHLGREALVHEVQLSEGTFLRQCYGTETLWVNSLHHQGVKILAAELVPAALSRDGLVEGFQHSYARCVIGVQWHPEMMTERSAIHHNLFRFFIENTIS